ncbi:hypothetical protein Metbo_2314 [Methanobacterium lacus]|uniref:Uncharacterized protein n=1 Tax=Methanobacterium lacus (strain AL-21) TaxID=877455 RepID=F0T621_METLA|nr:hypothetical protein [Methanobacterium lacus]ADZ10528.1 hypothetical protein Metbo_2314 [Methanobacterium lacus]
MRLSPIKSITLGFLTFFIIYIFIINLMIRLGFIFDNITLAFSLVVGSCIATYYTKEKKIQYGIYVGLIWAVLGLVPLLSFGFPADLSNLIINFLTFIKIIMMAIIGSYLAIVIGKHQKYKHENF